MIAATSVLWTKVVVDREADPVRTAEQLDHQHDLPGERQARARGGHHIGLELRDQYVAGPGPPVEPVGPGHLVELRVEVAGALAHDHRDVRELVQHHREDGGRLGQADPHVGQHGDHQGGRVEENEERRIEGEIRGLRAPQCHAERHAEDHGDRERDRDPQQRHADVVGEVAAFRLLDDEAQHRQGRRQQARAGFRSGGLPCGDEHQEGRNPGQRGHAEPDVRASDASTITAGIVVETGGKLDPLPDEPRSAEPGHHRVELLGIGPLLRHRSPRDAGQKITLQRLERRLVLGGHEGADNLPRARILREHVLCCP